jgi:hypothetical protein
MNGIFEKLITAYISDYIKDYDKNKLSKGVKLLIIQLTDGKLILDDIFINCDQLNKLKFPFKLKFAKLGNIKVLISITKILVPWNNFNDPTIIEIENIQALICIFKYLC